MISAIRTNSEYGQTKFFTEVEFFKYTIRIIDGDGGGETILFDYNIGCFKMLRFECEISEGEGASFSFEEIRAAELRLWLKRASEYFTIRF